MGPARTVSAQPRPWAAVVYAWEGPLTPSSGWPGEPSFFLDQVDAAPHRTWVRGTENETNAEAASPLRRWFT
jgi:hypothetical protein